MIVAMFALATDVGQALAANPVPVAAALALVGAALVSLMKSHRVTNKELAGELGVTSKEVAKARKDGIADSQQATLWTDAVERRSKKKRGKRSQEAQAPEAPADAEPEVVSEPEAPKAAPENEAPTGANHICLLPSNLAPLARLAAKEQHCRFGATTGVQLTVTGDGYKAEATNGRYLGIVTGPMEDAEKHPSIAIMQAAQNSATKGVIPGDAWTKAFRQLPKGRKLTKPILDNLGVVMSPNQITLISTDMERDCVERVRQTEGRFPDTGTLVKSSLKSGGPTMSVRVDAQLLIELLGVAKAYAEEEIAVELDFYEAGKPFVVRAANAEGQKFEGLLAPLVKKEAETK